MSEQPPTLSDSAYPIFIGGAGRSGTTLLRVILDSHSKVTCGPELKVTPILANLWADFQQKYRSFLEPFEATPEHINTLFRNFILGLLSPLKNASGKERIAEKSPNNIFYFQHLLRIFPRSYFVHVVRDCRDVVASLLQMDWKSPDGSPIPYTQSADKAAQYWVKAIEAGQRFSSEANPERQYLQIRYEDIVETPETTLIGLFEFLNLEWEPQTLDFHRLKRDLGNESSAEQVSQALNGNSIERWKRDLSSDDRRQIKTIAGKLLIDLGYCSNLDW